MRTRLLVLAVVLAATPVAAQPAKKPTMGLMMASHLRESQALVAVIDPARLTKSATASGLPVDLMWKDVKEYAGIDHKTVARAEVYVTPFPGGNVMFEFGAALRFTSPVADRQVRAILAIPPEKRAGAVAGFPWYESPRYKFGKDDYWAAFLTDPSTAVFTPSKQMSYFTRRTEKILPLAAAVETVEPGHEITVIIIPEAITVKVDRMLGNQKEPQYEAVKPALAYVKFVVVYADLGRDPMLRVEFRADSADGASKVAEAVKKSLDDLKAAYPAIEKDLKADLPKGFEAAVLATADEVVNRPKVAIEKSTVVVTVARPTELAPKKKK